MRWPFLLPVIACCLAGCGPGAGFHAPQGGSSDQETAETPLHRDVRLAIEHFTTDPKGPTTASVVTVHFLVVNHGADATPYSHVNGQLAYLPITWTVLRDGIAVASGVLEGLTGQDSAALPGAAAG